MKKYGILVVIVFVIAVIIIFSREGYRNNAICKLQEEFEDYSIQGKIEEKYQDPEFGMKEAILVNSIDYHIYLDSSGFYDYVSVDDSIVKSSGSTLVKIYRNGTYIKEFELDFGCQE
jgi:hypothetical protein